MAIPPPYADLGKSARDVFTKGYGFGFIKLDLKTKSENGLEFISSGSANAETSKVTGSLETKYKWAEYGLTFTEKWNTDNALGTEITVEDQLAKGLKLTFDSSFSPNTGRRGMEGDGEVNHRGYHKFKRQEMMISFYGIVYMQHIYIVSQVKKKHKSIQFNHKKIYIYIYNKYHTSPYTQFYTHS
ncbi:non-selective voltage-gated ion channel VDAC1 isoform X2 [Lithobates pipiens]